MSPYHSDAISFTIPQMSKDIKELFNSYEDDQEKLEAMKALRKELQIIYSGYIKLDKMVCTN